MKRDYLLIVGFLFLAIGVVWLASYWKGSVGFGFAYPIAGCNFNMNITNTGSSALFGALFTVVGAVLLFFTFVLSVLNLSSRKG
jgi:hypothetical protein